MTNEDSVLITPDQMRNARNCLGWSRQTLSDASDTSVNFIQKYEEFGRVSRLNLRKDGFDGLAVIRATLEQAGATFTNGDEPGVELRNTSLGSSK